MGLTDGLEAGQAGHGGNHHAGKELHGGNVPVIESMGYAGQDLKNTQGPAVMAQRRGQDGAYAEPAAGRQIDPRIAFRVMTEHHFAGADAIGGDARIRLQANTEIGSGAPGSRATNDLVSVAQGNSGSASAGQRLRSFRDHADGRLEIDFLGLNFSRGSM